MSNSFHNLDDLDDCFSVFLNFGFFEQIIFVKMHEVFHSREYQSVMTFTKVARSFVVEALVEIKVYNLI